jgi:hypothetical protein
MIALFQRLGGHYWVPGPPLWWNVVFYSCYVLWTFFPLKKPPLKITVAVFLGWITVGFGVVLFERIERRWNDRLTVSFSSVGHGTGILMITPKSRAVVYDVGCFSSPKRSGDVMSRNLWRYGKTCIDAVVLSHADSDHYNGTAMLAERFFIGEVFVSPYMFEKRDKGLDHLCKTLAAHDIPIRIIGDGDDLDGLLDANGTGYVFSEDGGMTPVNSERLGRQFERALECIGISRAEKKKRKLTFHSWRHFLNTLLRMSDVADSKVQSVTGHRSLRMTDHYTHFDTRKFAEVRNVQAELLTFKEPEHSTAKKAEKPRMTKMTEKPKEIKKISKPKAIDLKKKLPKKPATKRMARV